MSNIFFLNMEVEDKICQAKAVVELCMEQLGIHRTDETVEYGLWASANLLKEALEKLNELQKARHDADNANRNMAEAYAAAENEIDLNELLTEIRIEEEPAKKKRAPRKSSTSAVVKGKKK